MDTKGSKDYSTFTGAELVNREAALWKVHSDLVALGGKYYLSDRKLSNTYYESSKGVSEELTKIWQEVEKR